MELGEKLRNARMEAGLTQKQLCDGIVTRNMLSQIENGSARPSMNTLREFAERLGKSVSYFLEDTAVVSSNTELMVQLRELYDGGSYAKAAALLEQYREPDPVYDREKELLEQLCILNLARQAIRMGREPYAKQLLEKCRDSVAYCEADLKRHRLLLLGKIPGEKISARLPSLDEELRIRAKEALEGDNPERAGALLEACENREDLRWQYLRGKVYFAGKDYENAKQCFLKAEQRYPGKTAPLLEVCFRELGDFRAAYEYACRQRK